jgi:hypothetical protein
MILVGAPGAEVGPIRYVVPGRFDWGVYKAHGELILLVSGLGYLICFVVSVLLLRQVRTRGYPVLAAVTGMVTLLPMVLMSLGSVQVQLTTAHHQEDIHVAALTTVAASFLIVLAVRLLAGLLPRR